MVLAMPSGKFESVSNGFAYALGEICQLLPFPLTEQ